LRAAQERVPRLAVAGCFNTVVVDLPRHPEVEMCIDGDVVNIAIGGLALPKPGGLA
jgi:hypothetical protein